MGHDQIIVGFIQRKSTNSQVFDNRSKKFHIFFGRLVLVYKLIQMLRPLGQYW